MRPRLVLALAPWLALALLVLAAAAHADAPPTGAAGPLPASAEAADLAAEADLLAETNAARALHGLPALLAHEGLARAAREHAAENAARGVLDHGSPDPARDTPSERAAAAGVALVEIGENLARMPGPDVAANAVAGWLDSPPHRRNLLDPTFTHVGFGVADGPGGRYVTQVFAARVLDRRRAEARAATRTTVRWVLDVRGPVGTDVMAFAGGRPLAGARLGPSGARIPVPAADAGAGPIRLGVAIGPGRYAASDAGRLVEGAGWRRDGEAVVGEARVVSATLERDVRTTVEVVLAYDAPPAGLQLFVDGRHLPRVVPVDGELRAALLPSDASRRVSVGVHRGDGTSRVVERFTLLPGPPPSLAPGTVQGAASVESPAATGAP